MKRVTAIATATVMALLVALTVNVAGQQPDTRDRTIMTFSDAVELPGLRLERGTYVFRLADTATRQVIQVLSQDEKETLGQWLYVPAQRQEATGDTVITFREANAGSTPAVQFWYYPGERIGKEFIYPRDQALRIAGRTGMPVLTAEGPVTPSAPAQAAVQPAPQPQPESTQAAVAVPAPVAAPAPVAQVSARRPDVEAVGTAGSADQASTATGNGNVRQEAVIAQNEQNELPRTASPLPLTGLIALLSLAGAVGIRAFKVRQ